METCGFSYFANAATARSRGLEFESSTALTDNLKLIANYARTDSKMTSDVPTIGAEAGDDMTELKALHKRLADDVADTAKTKVPVRSGRLQRSIRGSGTRTCSKCSTRVSSKTARRSW